MFLEKNIAPGIGHRRECGNKFFSQASLPGVLRTQVMS